MLIELLKIILQSTIIVSFMALTIIGYIQQDWNLGLLLNLGLVILYVALYWEPI